MGVLFPEPSGQASGHHHTVFRVGHYRVRVLDSGTSHRRSLSFTSFPFPGRFTLPRRKFFSALYYIVSKRPLRASTYVLILGIQDVPRVDW